MGDRRSLIEGLKQTPAIDPEIERAFVFQNKPPPPAATAPASVPVPSTSRAATGVRAPISTRIRSDLAEALKRASLERQLGKIEPNTISEILETALEPWLKANGYLS